MKSAAVVIDVFFRGKRRFVQVRVESLIPSLVDGKAVRPIHVERLVYVLADLDGRMIACVQQLTAEIDLLPVRRDFTHKILHSGEHIGAEDRVILEDNVGLNSTLVAVFEDLHVRTVTAPSAVSSSPPRGMLD